VVAVLHLEEEEEEEGLLLVVVMTVAVVVVVVAAASVLSLELQENMHNVNCVRKWG